MKYIFFVAGKGTRLHPLTLKHPKSMYKLDENVTILQRMVELIRKYDNKADIVIVTGHMHKKIEEQIYGATFVYNPFYEFTNSIASLWFAQNHLEADNVVLIDGDIVTSESLVKDVVTAPVNGAFVLLDSSIKNDGDYNVEVSGNDVLVMSKELENYYGEYAGITKLDRFTAELFRKEVNDMVESGFYDQWYENALVQLIFKTNFKLHYVDVINYSWTEVDSVNDLLIAKQIYLKDVSKE